MSLAAPPIDEVILQALRKPEDRIFFLQYESQMVEFVHDAARPTLGLPPMNTYQRLLVRRCADQFRLHHQLDRNSHVVTLFKTSDSSPPSALLSDRAKPFLGDGAESSTASSTASTPPPVAASPLNFKIMRRDPSSSGRLRSSRDNSDSEAATSKNRKDMTIQEREASYKAARARIFGDLEDQAMASASDRTSPCPSSSSHDVAAVRARRDIESSDVTEFSRTLPWPSSISLSASSGGQSHHSHPSLRARAPVFHPPGHSTPAVLQSANDPASISRSNPSIQQQQMNGIGAWAQQTATYNQQNSNSRGSVPVRTTNGKPGTPVHSRENTATASPAPSSTSSRQSSRTSAQKPPSHPSLPSKPTWLLPNKEPSLSGTPSASTSTPPSPSSLSPTNLHNSTHVSPPDEPSSS